MRIQVTCIPNIGYMNQLNFSLSHLSCLLITESKELDWYIRFFQKYEFGKPYHFIYHTFSMCLHSSRYCAKLRDITENKLGYGL